MNVWHLRRPTEAAGLAGPAAGYVGANFGACHRDMRHDRCHDPRTGTATHLNLWCALNPSGATAANGAMRVLPRSRDPLFARPHHPGHMATAVYFSTRGDRSGSDSGGSNGSDGGEGVSSGSEAAPAATAAGAVPEPTTAAATECLEAPEPVPGAAVLEAAAGAACLWVPSAVHWGGACAAAAPCEPRASFAATFRRAAAPRSRFGNGGGNCDNDGDDDGNEGPGETPAGETVAGPPPLRRAELRALPLSRRLAYASKALLAYSHWHPGFPGLDLAGLA